MKKKFIEERKREFSAGKINRREFVTSLMAIGIATPAALSLSAEVMAMTPKKGGRFRQGFGHGSTTDTLDPSTFENGMMTNVGFTHANALTEVSNTGELIGELAETLESSDAKNWRFNLRKGVEFHNGKSLTADDVIATFDYHRGEDSKSPAKSLLKQVKSLSKDGDGTVVAELDAPNADFPYIVSDYHLVILPSKDGKITDPQQGVGTGPYVVKKFEPGVRAFFTRNANYWKADSAHFDEVESLSLLDTAARQNAAMNGDADIIDRVDPKTVHLLGRNPNLKIVEVTGTQHYTFPMRLNVAPFDNYDVRMALKYALNRKELVDKILLGHGEIGNDHPISVANRYHNGELPQREFDPDKARHHMKKAGYGGDAIPLSAADAAFAGAVDAAQLIKASAGAAGINIDVIREPKDGYWSNVWNKKGWCACYWGGRPTEDWMFVAAYTDDTEWNDTAWKTTDAAKKFNKLVKEARGELDEAKRRAIYYECQRLINDDGGAIVPMWANYIHGVSKKVGHSKNIAANWGNDGHKAAERWWFL